jgi:hypothetical protein
VKSHTESADSWRNHTNRFVFASSLVRAVPITSFARTSSDNAGAGKNAISRKPIRPTLSAMNMLKDPVLLVLLGLLALTVSAFFFGVLPYPFGILILLVFIVARVLSRRSGER